MAPQRHNTRRSADVEHYRVIDVGADDGTVMIEYEHRDGSKTTNTVPKELVAGEWL